MRPWAKGLLQASGKEEILQKDKPLKESYDRENNRLEEITRKKQAGRRDRKPKWLWYYNYQARCSIHLEIKPLFPQETYTAD